MNTYKTILDERFNYAAFMKNETSLTKLFKYYTASGRPPNAVNDALDKIKGLIVTKVSAWTCASTDQPTCRRSQEDYTLPRLPNEMANMQRLLTVIEVHAKHFAPQPILNPCMHADQGWQGWPSGWLPPTEEGQEGKD